MLGPKERSTKMNSQFSLKEKLSENASRDLVGAGKSRDFAALSAAAAAYFNQCTTTMIFIFMRQRNDLVSTYLNLHFNCLAHFMSHSSSRAKSADARARALRSALPPKKKRQESERQAWQWVQAREGEWAKERGSALGLEWNFYSGASTLIKSILINVHKHH